MSYFTKTVERSYGPVEELKVGKVAGHIVGALVLIILFFGSFTIVSPQEMAVITRTGSLNRSVGEGFHFKLPLLEDVTKMNISEQKAEYTTQAYSKDGQVIDIAVTANYQLNVPEIEKTYRETKNDFQNIYLNPIITPSTEEVITRYTAQELIEKKAEWTSEIKRIIVERIHAQGRGLTIKSIEINKFDFDDSYEKAIKNKQVQEQEALAQINITAQEKEKKAQEIFKAEALAEKTRLEAQALASQQGNKVIEKIEAEAALEAAKRWDGQLPTHMVPGGSLPFINLKYE